MLQGETYREKENKSKAEEALSFERIITRYNEPGLPKC